MLGGRVSVPQLVLYCIRYRHGNFEGSGSMLFGGVVLGFNGWGSVAGVQWLGFNGWGSMAGFQWLGFNGWGFKAVSMYSVLRGAGLV